jgi:hypothetical protein
MAITTAIAAQRVLDRLTQNGEDASGLYLPDIEAMIPDALTRIAVRVAEGDSYAELQKDYALTITAGVADISTQPILMDYLNQGIVLVGSVMAKWVPRFESLFGASVQSDVYHYAVRNRKLYFKNIADGSVTTLTASGTGQFNYIPQISELPTRLESELTQELVNMVHERGLTPPTSKHTTAATQPSE